METTTAATSEFARAQEEILRRYRVDAEARFVPVPVLDGPAHVLVTGTGPPVVMAIGGGMVAAMWASLMSELEGVTLYAFDPPGHGLSAAVPYRTESLRTTAVDFLDQLLDGLGIERAPFVAQSMGGLWSTWLALDRPSRVAAISYVGCPALLLGTSAPLPMRLGTIRPLRRFVERIQPPSPKQVDRLATMAGEDLRGLPELRDLFLAYEKLPATAGELTDLHRAAIRVRGPRPEVVLTAEQLARARQPVQFVWGERDPFGAPEVGRRAAEIMPDAEFHLVEGGHGPWFQHAESVGSILTPFVHAHA